MDFGWNSEGCRLQVSGCKFKVRRCARRETGNVKRAACCVLRKEIAPEVKSAQRRKGGANPPYPCVSAPLRSEFVDLAEDEVADGGDQQAERQRGELDV